MTKSTFLDNVVYEASHDRSTEPTLWMPQQLSVSPAIHFHQAVEVIYVEQGCTTMQVDLRDKVTISSGEFFVVDEAVLHQTLASTEGTFYLMLIPTAELDSFLQLRGNRCFGSNKCTDDPNGTLATLTKTIYDLRGVRDPDKRTYHKLLLSSLLSGILLQTGAVPQHKRTSNRLAPIIMYIQEHISEPFTIKELSAHFGYTPRNLSMLFEGMSKPNDEHLIGSLKQYIAILRLSNAKQLLEQGATLEEAAERSGYGCMRSFHRAFMTLEHMTPGDYAKRLK